ncbi:MAG: DUF4239 domain-containing protein [Acidimicrobiia bacterium]|nr:DUF4239 domain-containing protein [Acidimicrobiia bacterium]
MKAARQTWWAWARFEAWLSGLSNSSSPVLFGGFLIWFIGWTVLVGVVLNAVVDEADQPLMSEGAGRLIPAVGVLFALLTAFVITNQWNRSRAAEGIVGAEADASIRLALASQSSGIDGERVRLLLSQYLRSVIELEWETLRHELAGSAETASALSQLEQDVRATATGPGVGTSVTADLLAAAEGVAISRRDRLNIAGHGLPAPLFILAFVSGVVLCLNAIAVAVSLNGWVAIVIGGLVVLIALDLALVVAISDPFRGSLRVVPRPLEEVQRELEAGRFGSWR